MTPGEIGKEKSSSPGKKVHLKQSDLDELSRRSVLATRFNFKSRKKEALEKEAGIAEESEDSSNKDTNLSV